MKKDRLKRWLPSLACVFLAFGSGAALGQEKKIVLRVADAFPLGHYIAEHAAKFWMEAVKRSSNGAVDFEYYPAEQLGKAKDLLALTVSGVADVGYVAPSNVSDKMPLSGSRSFPRGSPTSCAGTLAYWKIAKDRDPGPEGVGSTGSGLLFTLALALTRFSPARNSIPEEHRRDENPHHRGRHGHRAKAQGVSVKCPARKSARLSRGTMDAGVFPYASVLSWKWDAHAKFTTVGENFGSFIANYDQRSTRWKTARERAENHAGSGKPPLITPAPRSIEHRRRHRKVQQRGVAGEISTADKRDRVPPGHGVTEWAEALDKRGKPGSEALRRSAPLWPRGR